MEFRDLTANDIDVRIAQCKENGVSLLLYKNARVDMQILDESVGAENWQRHHTRDNANCIISIWDDNKKQWIEKEDTGTESNTEKEKGLASDSFKRAGFNWGIGRELYTAPFIWIESSDCNIKATDKKDKFGKPVFVCKDSFSVGEIKIENKVITKLSIINSKSGKTVFYLGINKAKSAQKSTPKNELVKFECTEKQISDLIKLCGQKGVKTTVLCKKYKIDNLAKISAKDYKTCFDGMKAMEDKTNENKV